MTFEGVPHCTADLIGHQQPTFHRLLRFVILKFYLLYPPLYFEDDVGWLLNVQREINMHF